MSDFHEALFKWPHPEASSVIVTGSFDQWSGSVHLPKNGAVFEGPVRVPWGEKTTYKYIVDGRWTTTDDQPIETDPMGNVNNVYTAPSQPAPPPAPELASEEKPALTQEPVPQENIVTEKFAPQEKPAEVTVTSAVFGVVEAAKEAAVTMVESIAPGTTGEMSPAAETALEDASAEVATPPAAEREPASAPEPTPAPAVEAIPATEITAETVRPAESQAEDVAPIVPVTILPLSTESPTNGDSTPAPGTDLSASKPLDTAVIENAATAEPSSPEAVTTEASTHTPATNGVSTNGGVSAAPEAPGSPASPKPNGDASPAPASLPTTPSKDKRMRFPSIRSTSQRSSNGSASEFGERAKDTHASRVDGSQRTKRNSIFGKLRGIFQHDSPPRK